MKRFLDFLRKQPLLTGALALIVAVGGIRTIDTETMLQDCVLRVLLTVSMLFFLYLISENRTTDRCGGTTGYVIRASLPFWIFAFLVGSLGFLYAGYNKSPLNPNWPTKLLTTLALMLFVGLFEELTFRAIVNDAVIRQFRGCKGVFILSAVLCSLIFGAVHVLGYDLSSPIAILQAVLKTVSAGVFGLFLLVLYWKTRNIWGCAIVHGGYDFLTSYSTIFIESASDRLQTGYVQSGGMLAIAAVVTYVIVTLFNLVILRAVWKKIGKSLDFEEMRQTW